LRPALDRSSYLCCSDVQSVRSNGVLPANRQCYWL
jgi:hypothetical protein